MVKQAELDSRTTEIENLKLLILKLKRMHFGPRSDKYTHDIQQLELRLSVHTVYHWRRQREEAHVLRQVNAAPTV